MKDAPTKKRSPRRRRDQMRSEYDFSAGIRGNYASLYGKGTHVVLLEPEVAAVFPNSASVNEALRGLLSIAKPADDRERTS
jgi:hypothetical protein